LVKLYATFMTMKIDKLINLTGRHDTLEDTIYYYIIHNIILHI